MFKTTLNRNDYTVTVILLLVLWTAVSPNGFCQSRVRTPIEIPNIPGYLTLKCDFHTHTLFSDGLVWPTVRVEEAWREGLDGFALTDHLEYIPHQEDLPLKPNRSYELAAEDARVLNILLIRGAEITRDMPPGHLNAVFLEDANPLVVADYRQAIDRATSQGAFIFWNHPDFPGPEGPPVWNLQVEKLRAEGHLHGVEVANGPKYYLESHRWCLEKKLTMMGNSDSHNPTSMDYDFSRGEHRTMTLVFAEERTIPSIKNALFARRTAVYWKNQLIGEEQFLKPIFQASVEVLEPNFQIERDAETLVPIRNRSDIPFELEPEEKVSGPLWYSGLILPARKVALLRVSTQSGAEPSTQNVSLSFTLKNLLVAPGKGLQVKLNLNVEFLPPRVK